MALVVEDGTIVTDAESYISVADADVLIASRGGDAAWTALDTIAKEVQLRLSTEYLDLNYCYVGAVVDIDQSLGWPRQGITGIEDTEIPTLLKKALVVLAVDSIGNDLYINEVPSAGGEIKSQFDKLDVLETKTEYFSGGSSSTQNGFTEVDRLIDPLTVNINLIYRG